MSELSLSEDHLKTIKSQQNFDDNATNMSNLSTSRTTLEGVVLELESADKGKIWPSEANREVSQHSTSLFDEESSPSFTTSTFVSGSIPSFSRSNTSMKLKEAISLVRTGAYEISPEELKYGSKLGEGAGGAVFRGTWRNQHCAIKVLKYGFVRGTPEYRDLIVELGILARLGPHPNLVGFLGACVKDMATPALVLEFINGTDLEEYLSSLPQGFDLGRAKARFVSSDAKFVLDFSPLSRLRPGSQVHWLPHRCDSGAWTSCRPCATSTTATRSSCTATSSPPTSSSRAPAAPASACPTSASPRASTAPNSTPPARP